MAVEVFRTNVNNKIQAEAVLKLLCKFRSSYIANFDLEDCDRILRIECEYEDIQSDIVIDLIVRIGFTAEILSGDLDADYRMLHKIVCA